MTKTTINKALSLIATVAITAGTLPSVSFAQDELVHDTDCAFKEASECTHEHEELCYSETEDEYICVHATGTHDETCGYAEAADCTCAYTVKCESWIFESPDEYAEGEAFAEYNKNYYIQKEDVSVQEDEYPAILEVDGKIYIFSGFMLSGSNDVIENVTIPAFPSQSDEENYDEWISAWGEGFKAVYLLHTHEYGDWEKDEVYHWKSCMCTVADIKGKHIDVSPVDGACDICEAVEFVHDENCEYKEGSECTHIHDEELCYDETEEGYTCVHATGIHDDSCEYEEAVDCSCSYQVKGEVWTYGSQNEYLKGGSFAEHGKDYYIKKAEVSISKDEYPLLLEVGEKVYMLKGFMLSGSTAVIENITIPPLPSKSKEERYNEWVSQWGDGFKVVYMLHTHDFGEWKRDKEKHWKMCICNTVDSEGEHTDIEPADFVCDSCGLAMVPDGVENPEWSYFQFRNNSEEIFSRKDEDDYYTGTFGDTFKEKLKEMNPSGGYNAIVQKLETLENNREWIGSCYGFSVVEAMYNNNLFDIDHYHDGAETILDVPAPAETDDKDIRKLINYYYLTQFITPLRTQYKSYGPKAEGDADEIMLKLAEYIVTETDGKQNQAIFNYLSKDGYYSYGHTIILDGGIKNDDGSYVLNGYDSRYSGYEINDGENKGQPLTVDVIVSAEGDCTVSMEEKIVKADGRFFSTYPLEEVVSAFEYIPDDDGAYDKLAKFLPLGNEYVADAQVTVSDNPIITVIPKTSDGTAKMKLSDDNGVKVVTNDINKYDDKNITNRYIENVYLITGSTVQSSDGGSIDSPGLIRNKSQIGGMMVEFKSLSEIYNIDNVNGIVTFENGDDYMEIITSNAKSAQFNTKKGSVLLNENRGEFYVTITTDTGLARVSGRAAGDVTIAPNKKDIKITAPAGRYEVEYISADGTKRTENVTVKEKEKNNSSSGGGGGGGGGSAIGIKYYTVTFNTDGGSKIQDQRVTEDATVKAPENPTKEGYVFEGWYSDYMTTKEFVFSKTLREDVTVYAKWTKVEEDSKVEDKDNKNEWKNPFGDVKKDNWFYEAVKYANENSLMSGTSDVEFAPNNSITRAMLVAVLYRAEGSPEFEGESAFADVKKGAYYEKAVAWAEANGIVMGYSKDEFKPDNKITREQIAAIMYRYAAYKGYDVSESDADIESYDDYDSIEEYAIESIKYAVHSGLMKGKTNKTLNPKDAATRAEMAAILQRFIEGNK